MMPPQSKHALGFLVLSIAVLICAHSSPPADSPADYCDAFTAAGQENQQQVLDNLLTSPTSAPSDSPSASPLCSDPLSNARGVYTSVHAPCTIKFHSVSNFQREGEEQEIDFIDYRTSNLCRDDNIIVEIKEYLENFPDECVGDFGRCYSLQHHSKYLYPFLCLLDHVPNEDSAINPLTYHSRWELPAGTTHVSVDCTIDKDLVRDVTAARLEEERKHVREARREEMGMKLFNWLLVCLSTLTVIYAISHFIVTPLVTLAASKRDERRCRRRSSSSCNNRRNRTVRTSSTLSSSSSSLPMYHQEQEVFVAEERFEDGEGDRYRDAPRLHGSHSEDLDDSGASSDDSTYETTGIYDEQQQLNEFDSQVPCDFDAVPIVAATILPEINAIPAMVVQDGITYS
jgi:hypothetical protein